MILTIDVLFNEWFEYKKKRVKPTTIGTYRTHYQNHIRKCFLGADMSRGVNNEVMQTFVEILMSQGLSVKSAQDSKIVLSNIMKYAGRKYGTPVFAYQIEYPTKNMKLSQQIQFFSKEQCKRIFQEMEENPSLPLLGLVIGLTTGMRIGEICGLRFSDVDFGEKTITVNRTVSRVYYEDGSNLDGYEVVKKDQYRKSGRKYVVLVGPPKTSSSHRTCPLASLPLKWLKYYRKCSDYNGKNPYILSLTDKLGFEPRVFREHYIRILKKLEIPFLHPHCMRHTFATQMLHNGVDPATIASILGHSSPAITLEIYSHTNEDEKKKQVNAVFGKLFK